jgi:hypothetical protein
MEVEALGAAEAVIAMARRMDREKCIFRRGYGHSVYLDYEDI